MSRTSTALKLSLLSVILTLSSNACGSTPQDNPTLVYGLTLSPSGLDPHINASAELGIPLRSVYDTLVYLDPDSEEFIPGLAESWSISADGLQYTFDLRSDVSFHDGTPFNAQAVKKNIEYTLNPDHHSQKAAALLGPLEEVDVIDDYRVVLHLREPFAPLMDSLSQVYLGIASPNALEEWGPAEYQFHQVGTGPYRFVEYIPDDHILLERYDDYAWAPELYKNQKAIYGRIEFRFFEDVATRAIALESGNVDILGEIPPLDASRLSEQDGFNLHPVSIPGQPLQYLFNTMKAPTDDLQVRTALIHAVDRDMIVNTVFGSTSPVALGPLSQEGFGDLLTSDFTGYNPDKAENLLKEAGWELDEDGIRRNSVGDPLELVIIAPIWGSNPEVAQLIKVAWEAIGASVNLDIAPGFGPLREAQASGKYNAIGINFFGTDPDLLRPMFSSDGLYNWTGYANSDLDQLLSNAAQASLDPDLRKSLYRESIELITSESLLLPVRDYVNLVMAESVINSLRYSASGWFPILIDLEPNS
jgi:peptide/nickel transport system substrate-binding protein